MKKNINILRVDFDIDEEGNFDTINLRANIDLPIEFNNKLNDLLLIPIDEAVDEIKKTFGNDVVLFSIFDTALYNSKMADNHKIVNKQFLVAREMEYKRRENENE